MQSRRYPPSVPAFLPLLLLATIPTTGCLYRLLYRGDGKLRADAGIYFERVYRLDLGPVDLTRPTTLSFELAALPRRRFGLVLATRERAAWPVDAVVRLEVYDRGMATLVFLERSLHDLDPVQYRWDGLHKQSTYWIINFLDADGGWGARFEARMHHRYTVRLVVLNPAPLASPEVHLMAFSRPLSANWDW